MVTYHTNTSTASQIVKIANLGVLAVSWISVKLFVAGIGSCMENTELVNEALGRSAKVNKATAMETLQARHRQLE